jgi:hypothetical protein
MTGLRIAVIGDSVGWGQGLANQHKFGELVRGWLARRTGRDVAMDVYAHSGAGLVGPCTPSQPGEVPSSSPSVACQLAAAAVGRQKYDLVLLSGCINDLSTQFVLLGVTPVSADFRGRGSGLIAARSHGGAVSSGERIPLSDARCLRIDHLGLSSGLGASR